MSSASRKVTDDCLRFSSSLSAYIDGELDAAHAVDMEAHVIGCNECAERVSILRAMRLSMRRTASRERCPAALRARMEATVAHEKRRAVISQGPSSDAQSPKLIRLRNAVGLAAAAGVAFAMGMSRYVGPRPSDGIIAGPETASTVTGIDALLEQLIAMHAHPFQPDTTDADQLQRFDPMLGVRVRRLAFQPFGGSFQGARLHAVSDRGALLQLQYALPDARGADGKHITVYAFNPSVVPVRAARLQQRVVRQRPILVGRLGGYSVAALEQSGVGYAIASDFDTDESTRMVLSAIQQ
jgi:anti-sigma factor RsiW